MLIRIQLKKLSKKLHYEEFSAVEEEKNCSNVKNHGGGPIYFNNFNKKNRFSLSLPENRCFQTGITLNTDNIEKNRLAISLHFSCFFSSNFTSKVQIRIMNADPGPQGYI